jgi:hypothetical protein
MVESKDIQPIFVSLIKDKDGSYIEYTWSNPLYRLIMEVSPDKNHYSACVSNVGEPPHLVFLYMSVNEFFEAMDKHPDAYEFLVSLCGNQGTKHD